MDHPTESTRIVGDPTTDPGRQPGLRTAADAGWHWAHHAARRANPVGGVPSVRTPMPATDFASLAPEYDPVVVTPLREWPRSGRRPRRTWRSWIGSMLGRGPDPRMIAEGRAIAEEESLTQATHPDPSPITPRQGEYLRRIREEEALIAEQRRRREWSELVARHRANQVASTSVAQEPSTPVDTRASDELQAELERWRSRSDELASELDRAETGRRDALLTAAAAVSESEEARRAELEGRKESARAAARERRSTLALLEVEAIAEDTSRAGLRERELRLAAEERLHAEECRSEEPPSPTHVASPFLDANIEPVFVPTAEARPDISLSTDDLDPLAPLYAGQPASVVLPSRDPVAASVVLPGNLRRRRASMLERTIQGQTRQPRWRRVAPFVAILGIGALMGVGPGRPLTDKLIAKVSGSGLPGGIVGWVQPPAPQTLPEPANLLGAHPHARSIVASIVHTADRDIDALAANLRVGSEPPAAWMTAEYFARPSRYREVSDYFRRLGEFAEDTPKLVPTLAEADQALRREFTASGIASEALSQEAVQVFAALQGAWAAQADAARQFARWGSEFDTFLRTHEGSLTFMLGEFGHRDPAISTQAASLESSLGDAFKSLTDVESLVRDRMMDLGVSLR